MRGTRETRRKTRKHKNRVTALLPRTIGTVKGLKKSTQMRVEYLLKNTKRAFKGFSKGINNTTSRTLKRLIGKRR